MFLSAAPIVLGKVSLMIVSVSKSETKALGDIFVRKRFTQVNGDDFFAAKNNDLFTWRDNNIHASLAVGC